ncbi:MAG: ADP-ribosylglycohydrolase family protein [Gammaproteobacteria bacterium]|nr:ADP-ribosylglycohydrolase family protein [Gammaproteobacteria bacterium]
MDKFAFIGCLLGTAVGDALGLPYEGLSPQRGAKLFPDTTKHHLFFGKGMVSDDTEHACFVAQALIRSRGDVNVFRKQLARSLRWWLLALPAGVGFATLRSIVKLWFGFSPQKSGVFSAGNGPSMRTPIIGVAYGHDAEKLKNFVKASTEITHSNPKAYYAALAIALAAYLSASQEAPSAEQYLATLKELLPDDDGQELHELVERAAVSAANNESVAEFADKIGSNKGISGYSYHTVPCVLQVWFGNSTDFATGLQDVIKAGGDTDTAGAIYGGIIGAGVGKSGIPEVWLNKIIEWPKSIDWIEILAESAARSVSESEQSGIKCPRYFVPGILLRNLLFLIIVLAHGFRRLAPPW